MAERKDEIIRAALAVADDTGLAAVSMRTVAARVGVTAMALYRHVASKEELLDGILELLLTELAIPPLTDPWEDRLHALGHEVRALARRHPSAVSLVFERPGHTPGARLRGNAVQQALRDAGLTGYPVDRIERLLSTFVVGFALSEVAGRFEGATADQLDHEFDRDVTDLVELVRRLAAEPTT